MDAITLIACIIMKSIYVVRLGLIELSAIFTEKCNGRAIIGMLIGSRYDIRNNRIVLLPTWAPGDSLNRFCILIVLCKGYVNNFNRS